MAHELGVPIAKDLLTYGDFLARIKQKWEALRPSDPIVLKLVIADLNPTQSALEVSVRENEAIVEIHVEESAWASCLFYHFPYAVDPEDIESAYVNAVISSWRDPQSTLLMALAASSVAEVAGTFVIDEIAYLAEGRIVSPAAVDAIITTVVDLPLAAAGQQLFGRLWPGGPE